jgi:hypothetical protein
MTRNGCCGETSSSIVLTVIAGCDGACDGSGVLCRTTTGSGIGVCTTFAMASLRTPDGKDDGRDAAGLYSSRTSSGMPQATELTNSTEVMTAMVSVFDDGTNPIILFCNITTTHKLR